MKMENRYIETMALDPDHPSISGFREMHQCLMDWAGIPLVLKNDVHQKVMDSWKSSRTLSSIATELVAAGA